MVVLRKFERNDQERLLHWVKNPVELAHWAGATFQFPLTVDQLDRYRLSESAMAPGKKIFAACDEKSSEVVGHVELSDIWPNLSARIARILVSPNLRGRRLGGEIANAAADLARSTFGVSRVDLGFRLENEAAYKCYERIGFKTVGLWPKAIKTEVFDIDVVWMTKDLLDAPLDYKALQASPASK